MNGSHVGVGFLRSSAVSNAEASIGGVDGAEERAHIAFLEDLSDLPRRSGSAASGAAVVADVVIVVVVVVVIVARISCGILSLDGAAF